MIRRPPSPLPRLLAAGAALLLLGSCAPLPAATGPPALRVATYNIQYGGGGENLDGIAEAIRSFSADLVALQEVDVHWSARSGFADQATALAGALGMEVRFAPIYSFADTAGERPPREFGVALLSRHPITSFTNHPLARLSTQEAGAGPRPHPGFLEAVVNVRGTPVRVFNTHLDFRSDPVVREMQVSEMLALIGETPGPTILFGDLNAGPDAPELRPLLDRFRDAWHAGADGGFTMPSDAPRSRIDYVLVAGGIQVRRAEVPATTASDHRPVLVELVVVGTPATR